jgi:putative endonuclease
MYFVYLLECANGNIYTGITTDVERRFQEHLNSDEKDNIKNKSKNKGANYTRANKPVKILYTEKCENRSVASKREAEIKKWPRQKKLDLIKGKN